MCTAPIFRMGIFKKQKGKTHMGEQKNRRDKEHTEGIAVSGGFLGWLDNFWYHYKWGVIGVAVALIIVIVCTVQACSKEKEDIVVIYAGQDLFSQTQLADVAAIFSNTMPRDFDGNGKKVAALSTYQIYSEEQIRQLEASTDSAGNRANPVDRNRNSSEYNTYYNYLMTGESSVCLLDPWLYEKLAEGGRLLPLSEALGTVPDKTVDGYGIRLGDTALYREYGVLQTLSADTVICLLRPYVTGKSSKPKYYRYEIEMFASLVGETPCESE